MRVFSFLLAAALCLSVLNAPSAFSQEPPPRTRPELRRASLGYSLGVRDNRWAPVSLLVENPGSDTKVAVRGYFLDSSGAMLPMTSELELELPAGAMRSHTMFVRAGMADNARFELLQDNALIDSIDVAPTLLSPRDSFIVGLSVANQNFSCRQERGNGDGPRFRFHNSMDIKNVPPRWQGYEPADVLLIGALPPEGLSYPQERAIVEWVRAGGLLIMCPGGHPAHYEGTLLEEISPVAFLGRRLISDLPVLEERFGAPLPPADRRFGLTEAALRDGKVHMSMGEFPLVVSREEGAGKVVFVAFDLGAEAITPWMPLRSFYLDIMGMRARWPRPADTALAVQSAGYLDEMVGIKVLSRWILGAFLIANLALVVGMIMFARKRREAAFLGLIVAAPVIAIIINFVGARVSGIVENSLGGVHIAESYSGQDTAGCNSYYSLISPDSLTVDIGYPDAPSAFPDALVFQILGAGAERTAADTQRQSYNFDDGDIKKLKNVIVRQRAPSLFKGSYLGQMPGAIRAEATLTRSGVRFYVKNESDATLEEGSIAVNRNARALPDLSPGDENTLELTSASAQPSMAEYSRTAIRSRRQDLVNAAFAANRINDVANTGASAFGWIPVEPRGLNIEGLSPPPVVKSQTLWVAYADMEAEGTELLIPKGVASRRFLNRVAGAFEQGKLGEFSGRIDMNVTFGVPDAARGIEATRIDVWLRTARVPTRAAILALNRETGEYDMVFGGADGGQDEGPAPASRMELAPLDANQFSIPSPRQYLSKAGGEVTLRLIMEPVQDVDMMTAGTSRRPTIEEIDIEIEGIRE